MIEGDEGSNVYDRYSTEIDSIKESEEEHGGDVPYWYGFRCAVNKVTPINN